MHLYAGELNYTLRKAQDLLLFGNFFREQFYTLHSADKSLNEQQNLGLT